MATNTVSTELDANTDFELIFVDNHATLQGEDCCSVDKILLFLAQVALPQHHEVAGNALGYTQQFVEHFVDARGLLGVRAKTHLPAGLVLGLVAGCIAMYSELRRFDEPTRNLWIMHNNKLKSLYMVEHKDDARRNLLAFVNDSKQYEDTEGQAMPTNVVAVPLLWRGVPRVLYMTTASMEEGDELFVRRFTRPDRSHDGPARFLVQARINADAARAATTIVLQPPVVEAEVALAAVAGPGAAAPPQDPDSDYSDAVPGQVAEAPAARRPRPPPNPMQAPRGRPRVDAATRPARRRAPPPPLQRGSMAAEFAAAAAAVEPRARPKRARPKRARPGNEGGDDGTESEIPAKRSRTVDAQLKAVGLAHLGVALADMGATNTKLLSLVPETDYYKTLPLLQRLAMDKLLAGCKAEEEESDG